MESYRKPRWGEGVLWLPRSTQRNDAAFYSNRGIDYRKEGKLDLAIKDFDKAIELNPEFAEAYNNLGNVYDDKGDFDKAIVNFNTAIKFKPDFC